MSAFLFILVLRIAVRLLREVDRLGLVLDGVHAFFDVVSRRGLDQRLFLFLFAGKHLDLAAEEAFLGVGPELHLPLAAHREARLAREVGKWSYGPTPRKASSAERSR